MRKLGLIAFIFLCILGEVNGQDGGVGLSIGVAYRGRPQPIDRNLSQIGNPIIPRYEGLESNDNLHYSSLNFNVNFSISLNKNGRWHLQIANYIRRNHNSFEQMPNTISSPSITEKEVYRTKTDHLIDLLKFFPLNSKKSKFLKLGLGYGLMNTNTEYSWQKYVGLGANGEPIFITNTNSLDFWGKRFIIGFTAKRMNYSLIAHESNSIDFPLAYNWWVEVNLNYSFTIFKKKSK